MCGNFTELDLKKNHNETLKSEEEIQRKNCNKKVNYALLVDI